MRARPATRRGAPPGPRRAPRAPAAPSRPRRRPRRARRTPSARRGRRPAACPRRSPAPAPTCARPTGTRAVLAGALDELREAAEPAVLRPLLVEEGEVVLVELR